MNSASNEILATCQRFLNDLDEHCGSVLPTDEMLDLYQIGGSALVLHFGLDRPTKDFDVLNYGSSALESLAVMFGKTSNYAVTHAFYLELVPSALPAVPEGFRQRCKLVPGSWKRLRLWQPDIHDLIVTKLKRFSAQDRHDIRFLCDRFTDQIDVQVLQVRVDSALAWYYKDDQYQEGIREHLQIVIDYCLGQRTTN